MAPEAPPGTPKRPPGTPQAPPRCPQGPFQTPRDPPRPSPEITRAVLAAFVEHRFKNSPAASSHQPSASSQQPSASNQQSTSSDPQPTADSKPRRLFLQPSLHAIAGTAQQISMGFSQHSAWPGGMRGAIKSAAPCHKQGAGRVKCQIEKNLQDDRSSALAHSAR